MNADRSLSRRSLLKSGFGAAAACLSGVSLSGLAGSARAAAAAPLPVTDLIRTPLFAMSPEGFARRPLRLA